MSARKAKRQPKARPLFFTLNETGIPLGRLPEPAPCPFCQWDKAQIMFEGGEDPHWKTATAHCSRCGAQSAYCPRNDTYPDDASMVREAARLWNTRKGGAS